MLGKLLKYEIRATARWFLPIYAALVVTAIINRLFWFAGMTGNSLDDPDMGIIGGLFFLLFFGLLFALFVVSIIIMVQRFYKNLLGDEGYLMFTLPVTPVQNINSKLIVSLMWSVCSVLVIALIGIATVLSMRNYDAVAYALREMLREIEKALRYAQTNGAEFLLHISAAMTVSLACGIIHVYAAIAVGHLASRRRVALAVVAYIGLSWTQSILIAIVQAMTDRSYYNWWDGITGRIFYGEIWFGVLLQALCAAGMYAITAAILSNRLNLE